MKKTAFQIYSHCAHKTPAISPDLTTAELLCPRTKETETNITVRAGDLGLVALVLYVTPGMRNPAFHSPAAADKALGRAAARVCKACPYGTMNPYQLLTEQALTASATAERLDAEAARLQAQANYNAVIDEIAKGEQKPRS